MIKGTVISFVLGDDIYDYREPIGHDEMIDEKTFAALTVGARRLVDQFSYRCIEAIKVSVDGMGKPMSYRVKLVLREVSRDVKEPETIIHEFSFAPHHKQYRDYGATSAAITRKFVERCTEEIKKRLETERDQTTRRMNRWDKVLTPKQ